MSTSRFSEDERERDHQGHRLDHRVVPAEDRLQEDVADTWQPKMISTMITGVADQLPISNPTIVITGISAFHQACFEITFSGIHPWRARCGVVIPFPRYHIAPCRVTIAIVKTEIEIAGG